MEYMQISEAYIAHVLQTYDIEYNVVALLSIKLKYSYIKTSFFGDALISLPNLRL